MSYLSEVLADAPVGYWRLGESSGSAADSSGNAQTGTYTGSPTLAQTGAIAGSSSKAVKLSGASQYVSIPHSVTLNLGDTFTLEIWVKRNSVTGKAEVLLSKGGGPAKLGLTTAGKLQLRRPGVATIVESTTAISDTAWHHVVATKTGATVKLYIDTVDVTGAVTNSTCTNSESPLNLGAESPGAEQFLAATIDEVAVYNTALSAARVKAHYEAASALNEGKAAGTGSGTGAAKGERGAVGKAAGSGTGTGSGSGTRGRMDSAAGAGAGTGSAQGARLTSGKASGSGAGSGSAAGKRSRQATAAGSGAGSGSGAGALHTGPHHLVPFRVATETCQFFPLASTLGAVTEDTTRHRPGEARSAKCAASSQSLIPINLKTVDGKGTTLDRSYYYRVAVNLSAIPSSSTSGLWRAYDATNVIAEMFVTNGGRLRMWCPVAGKNPTEIEPFYIGAEEWVVVEAMVRVNSAGEGRVSWRANGKTVSAEQDMALRNTGVTQTWQGNIDSRPVSVYLSSVAINDDTAEGIESHWPGIGADVLPEEDHCLWGALMSGTVYDPGWEKAPQDKRTWDQFETNLGRKAGIVHGGDPWLTWDGFGAGSSDQVHARSEIPLKSLGSTGSSGKTQLAQVLEGKHDAAITAWAQAAKAYGSRVYLRPWWEMNGTWFGWGRASNYVEAWRYLVAKIRAIAPNVKFVWCVNTIWEDAKSDPSPYYPGDDWVDWVGIDGYNGENPHKNLGWRTSTNLFMPAYRRLRELAPEKPIMICEVGCSEYGGSKPAWIKDLLGNALPYTMPHVRALVWFNWNIDEGAGVVDWQIESTEASRLAFEQGISSSYYSPSAPTARTKEPKGITGPRATLRGEVVANGPPASYWFEYWKVSEPSVAVVVPADQDGDGGEGADALTVIAPISGLDKNEDYVFRLFAENELGEAEGAEVGFFSLWVAISVTGGYPSDDLAWRVDPPGGAPTRWGADESLIENVVDDLTLVSEMQGGYKEAKTALSRDPSFRWLDLMPYGDTTVYGPGFEKRWEGRMEKPPGGQGSEVSLEAVAVGHMAALEDDHALAGIGFLNSDHGAWGEPSVDRRKALIEAGFKTDASVSNGWQGNEPEGTPAHLLMDFSNVETVEGKQMAGYAVFDAGSASIGRILFELAVLAGPEGSASWTDRVGAAATDIFAGAVFGTDMNATDGRGELVADPESRFASVASYYGDAGGTQMTDLHAWILKVVGDHGLELQGAWPDVGLTAKQMLGYAVARFSYLEARDEDLEDDGFLIPHAWFPDGGELATIVKELTKYGLLDWFVYEDKRFQLRYPGTYGRRWLIPASESEFQEDGLDGNRLWRDIVVQFQDSAGRTRTVGPPGSRAMVKSTGLEVADPDHPAIRAIELYGENFVRRDLLVAQGVLDDARAIKLGENWLAEANELNRSGSCSIAYYAMDDRTVWRPASMVRSGDHVQVLGSGDPSFRKITHCEYQHSERKAVCSLDAPPEGIAALQERFQVELQARGLGS